MQSSFLRTDTDTSRSTLLGSSALICPEYPLANYDHQVDALPFQDVTGNEARRNISPIRKNARSARSGERDANPLGTNLHVKGLSRRFDNRDLLNTFSKAGRVQKAQIILDPHTRESRGYGFVTMESAEEALAAIQLLNATELHGKLITVEKVF
ncbi:hypothetical protein AAF712_008085 [Marasmius tenuissimus]|uniref:RRM domain-containing protein n=1 Tax=Marasmius tenuissimus TaxID=585030 RepID=A0ABR2ZTQ3_9AGAR